MSVQRLIRLTGENVTYEHTALRRDAKEMCAYYEQMIHVLKNTEYEAEYLSHRIGENIEEDTFAAYVVRKVHML